MEQPIDVEVLICGAGAAGLTLAIELARRGIALRIVEKLPAPFAGSRGKGIQLRTQEVFEDIGVIDRLFAVGGLYPGQREYLSDGGCRDSDLMEASVASPTEPFNLPLMVPQFLTERVLRDRLAELGHLVEFGCELISFAQDDAAVVAQLGAPQAPETVRARYLIGADGGRSIVRKALGIGFPGKTLGVRALVADVTLSGLSRDFWHRFGGGDMQRQVSICPLAGTGHFQIQAPVPIEGDVETTVDALNALVVDRTGRDDILVGAVSWASVYSMNARLADRYRVGRVLLVGDAAHIHPPTGGQGLNTSVQDAYNLGWKLAAVLRGGQDRLLTSYEEERRAIAAEMLGLSTGLLDQMKQGVLRRGRDVQQLDLGYRGSSLALDAVGRDTVVQAGDRAPDARLTGSAGQPRRIFDLLSGPHWTMFDYGGGGNGITPRPGLRIHRIGPGLDLADDRGEFASAYGVENGDCVVIRPDGYIGAIVACEQAPRLAAYLHGVGVD
ncbi:FAD-dependent oxidoreductase [Sphingomonas sp.]|uniref:FAD-dependent oxidoreductase n=1 Tax=Sphingomonas sp. TaxID=28214 RepID=UPI002C910557|nr:FAD-dependent oxidoreductase [Sphingomonas sp.]HWK36365.1 FAD-dependent oxidoreductase [Sphingomonas sp.]